MRAGSRDGISGVPRRAAHYNDLPTTCKPPCSISWHDAYKACARAGYGNDHGAAQHIAIGRSAQPKNCENSHLSMLAELP